MESNNRNIYALGARQGAWAGAYFSVIFLLQVLGSGSLLAGLLSNLMSLAVPVILFVMLRNHYRESGYSASVGEIWMHGIMIFLCGSVILTLVSYVFLRYIDPGFIYRETGRIIAAYRTLGTQTTDQIADMLAQARDNHMLPNAPTAALSLFWLGGFSGSVLSLIETQLSKVFVHKKDL